ncbi:ATP-dependent sacrificial sulfur transferase LarE [Candidatus Latescibacterota bacterium]
MPKSKLVKLKELLRSHEKVAIAFSGGVDSTFLAKAAYDALGQYAVAITIDSEAYPPSSILETRKMADHIGIRLIEIKANACDIDGFRANESDRCYHCKKALFTLMIDAARVEGVSVIMDGTNSDDSSDYRPGTQALEELGVLSPLREIGFSKDEIRACSKELGLPTWNHQSFACLASRVPYGSEITPERLDNIGRAESLLRDMGFSHYRVRDHGILARLELDSDGIDLLKDDSVRKRIVDHIKACGFTYVTLDLQGFRTGSMNEVLPSEQ